MFESVTLHCKKHYVPWFPTAPHTMTDQEAKAAADWYRHRMGLADWRIRPVVQDEPPAWCADDPSCLGRARAQRRFKEADVWVSNQHCQADEADPLAALFHEMRHVLYADAGLDDDDSDPMEYLHDRDAELAAELYRRIVGEKDVAVPSKDAPKGM